MKRLFQTCLLALLAVAARAVETTLNVDTSQPKAVLPYLSFDQGAVYDYRVYVKSSGRRADLTGADVCVIQFSSNLTESAWAVFTSTSVNTNNGSFLVPSGYFTGPLGDGLYQVYTYSTNNPARKYGLGNGTFRLEQTSGYGTVTPGFYTIPLNTDIVSQTGTNRFVRQSEIVNVSGYVTTNAFYGTTDVIRASVETLSDTVIASNALFFVWFAGLQGRTNFWNTAFGWGDHAGLYLTTNDWAQWKGTNTYVKVEADELAIAFATTNRVTTWPDESDPLAFWVETGSTNRTKYTRTVSGTNFAVTLSADFMELVTQTRPAWTNHVWPFTDGIFIGEDATPLFIISAAGGASWSTNISGSVEYPVTLFPFTESAQGTATVVASYNYATNVAGVYNLTTGNVWTAVASVQADLTQAIVDLDSLSGSFNSHAPLGTISAPHLLLGDRALIDSIPGRVSSNNGTANNLTLTGEITLTNDVRVGCGWTNGWRTFVLRSGTTNFNILLKVP